MLQTGHKSSQKGVDMSTAIERFVNIEIAIAIVGMIGMAIIAVMAYIGMEEKP